MQPKTVLRVLRRQRGSLKDEASRVGLSVWTLRRAEKWGAVGTETRRKIQNAFELPWQTLMRPFTDQILEEVQQ